MPRTLPNFLFIGADQAGSTRSRQERLLSPAIASVRRRLRIGRVFGRTALLLGAPRVRKRLWARRSQGETPSTAPLFEIYTFVTDDAEYAAMQSSFAAAGMKPPLARFVRLTDGRDGGPANDPFAAITHIGSEQSSRYAILCHQDVRLDQGAGSKELLAALARLEDHDSGWVVAGNAGVTRRMRIVRRLVDPHGGSTSGSLPAQVASLDENFLVLNRRWSPQCSPGLSGFHLYGTDVCLNAMAKGGTAYVIDYPLTHLSGGRRDNNYLEVRNRFLDVWNRRRLFLYLRTVNEIYFISRSRLLRRLFGSRRAIVRVWSVAPPTVLGER